MRTKVTFTPTTRAISIEISNWITPQISNFSPYTLIGSSILIILVPLIYNLHSLPAQCYDFYLGLRGPDQAASV